MACKNKKCNKGACSPESAVKINMLPMWFPTLMSICKVVLILMVFIIASFQWGYTNDVLWQCIWSLSLIKLVELSDE
jgi:hypothetical protein